MQHQQAFDIYNEYKYKQTHLDN